MKSRLIVVVLGLSLLVSCGGGNSSSSTPTTPANSTVSLTPATASVATNTTAQLTATVSNSSAGVYWSVNGVVGGNVTIGTVNTAGLYAAPAVVPNPATVTITATSVADTTQFATATITITSGTALALTISPTSASVYTGRTLQFTATFNATTNTGVTWQVNTVTGGDSTNGTITASGLYTAPATVPTTPTVTITAISQSDTSKSATASVTIVLGSTIVVTPAFITLPAGGTQTFTATVNNQPVSVTWALTCNSTKAGACGSITSAGVYTAPAFPPPGGAVAITATSTDQSALPAGANVTVRISNGSLAGQYAFSMTGKNNGSAYASAGSITFDGSGNITGGAEDVNNGAATSVTITGGTYHIGTDGRGNATVQTSVGTETWQIAIKDNGKAYLMRGDSGATGIGTLYLQDATKFAVASVTGNYALQLSGPAAGQAGSAAEAGAFSADGAGVIGSGKLDVSEGTTANPALSVTGVYTAPSSTTGRGTLTLTSNSVQNFAYYLIDATRAVLVETDAGKILRGDFVQQPAGPFTLGSFAGSYAMTASGSGTPGPVALGGIFTLDGAGNVSNGVSDVNSNGNLQNAVPLTGTYVLSDAVTGRVELAVNINGQPRKFALYPAAGNADAIVEIDGVQTTSGRAYRQATNVNTTTQFTGAYAVSMSGTDFINSPGEEDATGLFAPNGGSALTGTIDINDNGTLARNATVQASYLGTSTPGRVTSSLSTSSSALASGQFIYYVVDANHVLILETDSSRVLVGIAEKP